MRLRAMEDLPNPNLRINRGSGPINNIQVVVASNFFFRFADKFVS